MGYVKNFKLTHQSKTILVAFCWLWSLIVMHTVIGHAQSESRWLPNQETTGDWEILEMPPVTHYEHPGFSQWCTALGDINNDGYDDFAVASSYDTTFIFLGGDTLNHEPALFLLGGTTGIASGDFNGDGRMDLATAIEWRNRDMDPDGRGEIRIFLHHEEPPHLGPHADMILRGDSGSYWGGFTFNDLRCGVQSLDFNADGYDDLLVMRYSGQVAPIYLPIIFLGGEEMDANPDIEVWPVDHGGTDIYTWDFMSGDLNGDGCDDILLCGSLYNSPIRVDYWDLFLGNKNGTNPSPYRTLRSDIGWSPRNVAGSAVYDVNNDGIDDIIDAGQHREYGDPLVFLGSPSLPEIIQPNDSIQNPWPDRYGIVGAWSIHPVGDMNGDGTKDLLISWATYLINTGSLYYLYPMYKSGLWREHSGHIGMIPDEDHVKNGAYNVGDVNGDGYDDFAVSGRGKAEPPAVGWWLTRRFIICLGAKKLSTNVESRLSANPPPVAVFPNPVPKGTSHLTLTIPIRYSGSVPVRIVNILGKLVASYEIQYRETASEYTLELPKVEAGVYVLKIGIGDDAAYSFITIL
ncbi:T9SS type A sorting domain-containing protein [bacterium]|nr:T9SS type A sorting domain-containing protein [bacterium]